MAVKIILHIFLKDTSIIRSRLYNNKSNSPCWFEKKKNQFTIDHNIMDDFLMCGVV